MEIEDTQPLVQEKRPKTILLESWVWFAVAALTCFTISDYVLSMFGDLGVKLVFYYNAGPILACTVFYAGRHQGLISKSERSLFWTDDGQLDKKTVALAVLSFVSIAILPLLNYNFTLAHKANLNIGLVLSVHASQTFFVALADFLIFGIILRQS
jgi:hypothetical protein